MRMGKDLPQVASLDEGNEVQGTSLRVHTLGLIEDDILLRTFFFF